MPRPAPPARTTTAAIVRHLCSLIARVTRTGNRLTPGSWAGWGMVQTTLTSTRWVLTSKPTGGPPVPADGRAPESAVGRIVACFFLEFPQISCGFPGEGKRPAQGGRCPVDSDESNARALWTPFRSVAQRGGDGESGGRGSNPHNQLGR